jgi:antitoxin StbD
MIRLYSNQCATISELKANPNSILEQSGGNPVLILSHNKPITYLVPVETFEQMQKELEEYRLLQLAQERLEDDTSIPVTISELSKSED